MKGHVQRLVPPEVELPVIAACGLDEQDRQQAIQDMLRELSALPFDLQSGPLYRYRVLKLADDDHVFVQNLHHIVSDGWSSGVVNAELATAYQALLAGREPDFGEQGMSYIQYAADQRERMTGEAMTEELDWWADRLVGLPTLEFPTDRPRPATPVRGAGSVVKVYPAELLGQMRALARKHRASLYMVIVAALNVVLCRYTGQDDIAIGVPMLNRLDEDMERVVGLFVNMVVARTDLSGDPSFAELLEQVLENNMELYEHQEVPFHLIVDRVQPVRTAGLNPLFQIACQLLGSANSGSLALPGLTGEQLAVSSAGSRFDMAIDFVEDGDSLRAFVEYSKDLFDEWRIRALLDHIETVLAAVVGGPSLRVSELPLLSQAERDELLALGRGESAEYSADPLHVSLARVAQATPNAVAVVCRGAELTYAELDRRADLLARHLRGLGLRHGQVAGVVLDRDLDAFVAMVGVLKAGGAFAMMDPKLPTARLDFMIRDTAAPVVLTRSGLAGALPQSSGWVTVALDTDWDAIESAAAPGPLPEWTTRESLAYVLYTSGSTGTPKGVMIAHRAVSFFCEAYRRSFDFGPADRLLQLPALNFDMSQGEIWTAFLVGATVVAVSPEDAQSPEALSALLRDQRVTYAALPLAMQSLMDPAPYPALKYVMGGAELLDPVLVNKWNLPGRKFLNLYGPTECAIGQTEYEVEHIEWTTPPPIGHPQLNRQVYIVDRWNNLVPRGVNGELLIGGEEGGLAKGYLNQPELTGQRFITDPFNLARKVYRSGDLVRWNVAGEIDFLGRLDNQVKLRGLRIELGEVETVLQSHPGVLRAVVLMRPDRNGENRLVGYFTSPGEPPGVDELRRHMGESLPDYMVPTAWVALDKFPMNNDGWKVNRNALPDPSPDDTHSAELVMPATATEEEVARCLAEVLGVPRVGAQDSFFDLGGNSLQALRVVSRLSRSFGLKLRVRLLYGNETVAGISAAIDELTGTNAHA
jgi:amino acid adenylation domain-containing protein